MIFVLKLALAITFIIITIQDLKSREVYWFLFPLLALLAGFLHKNEIIIELFYFHVFQNLMFTIALILILFIYFKGLRKQSLKEVIGLGDILMFIALAFSFATFSYVILFGSSLIFSLVLSFTLRKKRKVENIPLAGYMAVFFLFVYLGYWIKIIPSLYSY